MKQLSLILITFLITIFTLGLSLDKMFHSNLIDGITVLGTVGFFMLLIWLTKNNHMNEIQINREEKQ